MGQAVSAASLFRGYQRLTVKLVLADFTDNLDATGEVNVPVNLPAGALVGGWVANILVGFTGGATAGNTMTVGITSGSAASLTQVPSRSCDAVEKVASTLNVSNQPAHNVTGANTPTVTITCGGSADFTELTAGEMDLTIFYALPPGL